MIFIKSTLAGVAALTIATLIICACRRRAPHLGTDTEPRGGMGVYEVGPFPMWPLVVVALLIFCGGFSWGLRRARRHR